MNVAVVIVVGLFFAIGVIVGVIIVIAMAGIRSERRAEPGDPRRHERGGRDVQPSDPMEDYQASDERPGWPGDSASRYRAS
jgi:hypothetical protein